MTLSKIDPTPVKQLNLVPFLEEGVTALSALLMQGCCSVTLYIFTLRAENGGMVEVLPPGAIPEGWGPSIDLHPRIVSPDSSANRQFTIRSNGSITIYSPTPDHRHTGMFSWPIGSPPPPSS